MQREDNKGRCTDNLAGRHPIQTIGAPVSNIPTIIMPDAIPAATLPVYHGLGKEPSMLGCIPGGLVCILGGNGMKANSSLQISVFIFALDKQFVQLFIFN